MQGYSRRLFGLFGFILALALCSPAAKARTPKTILLESHSLPRSKAVRGMMETIGQAMGGRVLRGPALAAEIERHHGRSSRALSRDRLAALLATVKRAARATQAGEWARATPLLLDIRRHLGRDILSLSNKAHLFRALQKTRILLAICYLRMRQRKEAWNMMEETLLAQPGIALPAALYGPLLQQLYLQVKSIVDLRRGALSVKTNPVGALVFLSGRSVGFSPVTVKGLYQGTYEVMVVWRDRASRIKRVTVGSRPTTVRFDRKLDRVLRTTITHTELRLPEGPGRDEVEERLALRTGSALGAERILVVGLQKKGDRKAILGKALHVKRRTVIARAYVAINGSRPSKGTLRRLARFLLHGGEPGQGVIVVEKRSRAPRSVWRSSKSRHNQVLVIGGWLNLSLGLACIIGGAVALGLDGKVVNKMTTHSYESIYVTAKLGYALVGSGLAVAAVGATLLVVDRLLRRPPAQHERRTGARSPRLLFTTDGSGALVGLSGRF